MEQYVWVEVLLKLLQILLHVVLSPSFKVIIVSSPVRVCRCLFIYLFIYSTLLGRRGPKHVVSAILEWILVFDLYIVIILANDTQSQCVRTHKVTVRQVTTVFE